MKSFKTHQSGISLTSPNVDITQILNNLSIQYKFEEDYVLIRDISRDDVQALINNLPYDMDYDVYDHVSTPDVDDDVWLGDDESDYIELWASESNEFTVILYLYNTYFDDVVGSDVADDVADGQQIGEAKRVVKVNAKGKRRIKMKCRKGFKWTGGKCEKISGSEKSTKRRAIRKSVRTKKAKGSGFRRIVARKTKKAMRKRNSMGLRRK